MVTDLGGNDLNASAAGDSGLKEDNLGTAKRIVVKIGSSLLVQSDGAPNSAWLLTVAEDIAKLRDQGKDIIVVSSGAVALGAKKLGIESRENLTTSQACAAVGQINLAGLWTDTLQTQQLIAAQMLLTLDDLEDRRRYLNISSTLEKLIQTGAIPIINENDSVATEEIRYGDNDRLAARVAQACNADCIILLSDVDGLFDRNPSEPSAKIIPNIYHIDETIISAATGATSDVGTCGMTSKVEAAATAMSSGINMIIASGQKEHPLSAIQKGEAHSLFHKQEGDADRGQKKWLNGRLHAQGKLFIDDGAALALSNGASLLAVGVKGYEQDFLRGDVVEIIDPVGTILARGLSEYDAREIEIIMGKSKDEIAEILSYTPRSALVHRNHMVMI